MKVKLFITSIMLFFFMGVAQATTVAAQTASQPTALHQSFFERIFSLAPKPKLSKKQWYIGSISFSIAALIMFLLNLYLVGYLLLAGALIYLYLGYKA